MNWSFFQRRVCLTTGPEWSHACAEFERVGMSEVWRYDALPAPSTYESFNLSVRKILADFHLSGAQTLLSLEDDVVFRDLSQLEDALSELPSDWDIVYLGANLMNGRPAKYSDHLHRVTNAWTTHAVGYNQRVIPYLLANQPPSGEGMFDDWLSSQLPKLNAFVVNPMAAWQRPRFSPLWGREANYDPAFQGSQELLG
jgi:hypothetical protein